MKYINQLCSEIYLGCLGTLPSQIPRVFFGRGFSRLCLRREPQLGCLSQADEQTGNSTFLFFFFFFYRRFLTRSGFSPFMLLENNESKIKRRKGSGKGARLHAEMGEQAMESLILKFKETQSEVNFFFSHPASFLTAVI